MSRVAGSSFANGPPPRNIFYQLAGSDYHDRSLVAISPQAGETNSAGGSSSSQRGAIVPRAWNNGGGGWNYGGASHSDMKAGAQIAMSAFEMSSVISAAAVNQMGNIVAAQDRRRAAEEDRKAAEVDAEELRRAAKVRERERVRRAVQQSRARQRQQQAPTNNAQQPLTEEQPPGGEVQHEKDENNADDGDP